MISRRMLLLKVRKLRSFVRTYAGGREGGKEGGSYTIYLFQWIERAGRVGGGIFPKKSQRILISKQKPEKQEPHAYHISGRVGVHCTYLYQTRGGGECKKVM